MTPRATRHKGSRDSIEAHLPLKPVVFHILLSLAEDDLHGYAVMQRVRELSEGRIPLTTGSFYRHLAKLLEGGLVEEASDRPESDDPRRGSYFRLTGRGRQVVAAEGERLAALVARTADLGLIGRG